MGKVRKVLPLDSSAPTVTQLANDVEPRQASRLSKPTATQHVLPLTVYARPLSVTTLKRRDAAERRRKEAEQHFESALALEDSDVAAARAAYLAALDAHSEHLEARINLGRLLHLNGEFELAERIYRDARHSSGLLSFNLAILLEDLNREAEAVLAYREALALDPSLHDAHFNLSRLHERADRPQDALRHLLAYRRQAKDEED
jgi:tetratricopeptide (TPR) repeat protein